jgi:hypothetical protein
MRLMSLLGQLDHSRPTRRAPISINVRFAPKATLHAWFKMKEAAN